MTSKRTLYFKFVRTIYFHQFHNKDRRLPFTLQLTLGRLVRLIIQFKQFLASLHQLVQPRYSIFKQDLLYFVRQIVNLILLQV